MTSLTVPPRQQVTFERLLQISMALSGERDIGRLHEQILEVAQDLTNADGGTLYIVNNDGDAPSLRFEVIRNDTLNLRMGGFSGEKFNYPPISLFLPDGTPNHANISAHVFHQKRLVNIENTYDNTTFDFVGVKEFDQKTGYHSRSLLTVPLVNHAGDIIGILQLINATDPDTGKIIGFAPSLEPIVISLAAGAAVTLDNQILLKAHKDLLDAFVRVIAQAIDAKSLHTSGHCQRVPVLTKMLAQAACDTDAGSLKDFSLDDNGWYELHVASWLHDCGKLSTPDSVLDKSTKLHALSDRIETVKTRFAALISQVENSHDDNAQARIKALRDDCAFLEQSNKGSEFMRPEDQARVRRIAQYTWRDYMGIEQPMLTTDEMEMLCITRGTLSEEERAIINDHIRVTIQMLESLPFPKNLAKVPEYAGGHHERMDGTGYPRGLTREQMSWPARMMAIADVFEALTARDRPYKSPMPMSQALTILKSMCLKHHIDPDLYALFIETRIWEKYAQAFLLPEQLDVADPAPYLIREPSDKETLLR